MLILALAHFNICCTLWAFTFVVRFRVVKFLKMALFLKSLIFKVQKIDFKTDHWWQAISCLLLLFGQRKNTKYGFFEWVKNESIQLIKSSLQDMSVNVNKMLIIFWAKLKLKKLCRVVLKIYLSSRTQYSYIEKSCMEKLVCNDLLINAQLEESLHCGLC